MIKSTYILSFFLFLFFLFLQSGKSATQPDNPEIQTVDVIRCVDVNMVVVDDFSYRPFGKMRYTEKSLTDSLFKGVYREKCMAGYGVDEDYFFYSFYTNGGKNQYIFNKKHLQDEYYLSYAVVTSDDGRFYMEKGVRKIRINSTKKSVAEIWGIQESNISDTLCITSDEINDDCILYFKANLLKKIHYSSHL